MPVMTTREMSVSLIGGQGEVALEHKGQTQEDWTMVRVFVPCKFNEDASVGSQQTELKRLAIEAFEACIECLKLS